MAKKTILIAGATGLVGYAALKHFTRRPGQDVMAVSRRMPRETYGAMECADYQMRYGRTDIGPPSIVSTVKINQAGFHDTMDTEVMFQKWFRVFQRTRLLPLPDHAVA